MPLWGKDLRTSSIMTDANLDCEFDENALVYTDLRLLKLNTTEKD